MVEIVDPYNDETSIRNLSISYFEIDRKIGFLGDSFLNSNVQRDVDLFLDKNDVTWVDNSSNTNLPPDFHNEELGSLIEVMRVDNFDQGLRRKGEASMRREIRDNLGFMNPHNTEVHVVSNYGSRSYDSFLLNVTRVVNKHNNNADRYRRNYSASRLGFFIFDESDSFMLRKDLRAFGSGEFENLRFYWPYYDPVFSNYINGLDVDFVIWFRPYIQPDDKIFPRIVVLIPGQVPDMSSVLKLDQGDILEPIETLIKWSNDNS